MTEPNKNSLEFYIYKKTGGLHDPRLVKEFIGLFQEWLPPVEKGTAQEEKLYYSGYNAYKGEILENLWWKKND
jgi:hypothetical protein